MKVVCRFSSLRECVNVDFASLSAGWGFWTVLVLDKGMQLHLISKYFNELAKDTPEVRKLNSQK